jgi:hypothetical protein
MSDASSTLTPERLAEIERDAARRLREPWLYPLSPSVTLALCAALRAAWAERDVNEHNLGVALNLYKAALGERDRLAEEVERTRKHPPCRLCGAPYEVRTSRPGIPLALYCEDCHSKGLR